MVQRGFCVSIFQIPPMMTCYLQCIIRSSKFRVFFFGCTTACGSSVPQPRIEPVPPALEAWSPNHWTSREVPDLKSFRGQKFNKEDNFFVHMRKSTYVWSICFYTFYRIIPYAELMQQEAYGKQKGDSQVKIWFVTRFCLYERRKQEW